MNKINIFELIRLGYIELLDKEYSLTHFIEK